MQALLPNAQTLNPRRELFIEYYLAIGRAPEAARLAGYRNPVYYGYRLLQDPKIKGIIAAKVETVAMSANEVLSRLGEHATASVEDFINEKGEIDLKQARDRDKLHLIRKISQTTKKNGDTELTLELVDQQNALIQLGRHLQLFTDRIQATTTNAIEITYVNDWRDGVASPPPLITLGNGQAESPQ